MQNLWSRVAQTRCTCHCPSCVFTKAAVARRAATTGRGQFIKPVLQSATFSYSALLASAVAIDGATKQSRRENLDHDLAEAKERLDNIQTDASLPTLDVNGRGEKQEEPQKSGQSDVEILGGFSWLDTYKYDVEEGQKPAWPRNSGPKVSTSRLPPQSLWATAAAAEAAASKQWSERKLRTLELGVGKFILDTLIRSDLCADGAAQSIEHIPPVLQPWISMSRYQLKGTAASLNIAMWEVRNAKLEDWEAVYRRQTGFIPQLSRGLPHYEHDDQGAFRETQTRLNQSLFQTMGEALRSTDNEWHQNLCLKICSDLLCSSAPPTHKTINLLLLGFSKLNDDVSAEGVRRLMSFAHIRPNERTCAAILNHYTLTQNPAGFTRTIEKMRGEFGGFSLAKPTLAIKEGNNRLLMEKPSAESRKVVQKVQPTPYVLNAIITGLLRFLGLERSMDMVQKFQADGWGIDKRGLELFLRECVKVRDWQNGYKTWLQMGQLGLEGSTDLDRYALILRLCLDCKKEDHFRSIYDDARAKRIGADELKFRIANGAVSRLNFEDTADATHPVNRQLKQLGLKPVVRKYRSSAANSSSLAAADPSEQIDDFEFADGLSGSLGVRDAQCSQSTSATEVCRDATAKERHTAVSQERLRVPILVQDQSDHPEMSSWSPMLQEKANPTQQSQVAQETDYEPAPWGMSSLAS